jgi:hypothetical protein
MFSDLSFWIYISQLILVLMGVWIALHEDWAKRHRFLVMAAFIVAGFAGLWATRQQSIQTGKEISEAQKEAAAANRQLSNTLEKINNQSVQIGNQTSEISRVQDLNTELQERLLGTSKEIASLSQKSVKELQAVTVFAFSPLIRLIIRTRPILLAFGSMANIQCATLLPNFKQLAMTSCLTFTIYLLATGRYCPVFTLLTLGFRSASTS